MGIGKRQSSVKPSTVTFTGEARCIPGYSFWDWLHGQIYARWPYFYIGVGTGEHPLARLLGPLAGMLALMLPKRPPQTGRVTFADTYHGKVVTLAAATQLVKVDREITLPNLEQIIPYALARDIVLKNPDHIVALDCPCRSVRSNPCLPLDVCLIVGEPFAGFVAEHHPKRTRWVSQDEAAEILKAEHERGHVQHAFFKDAMLGRFYAICNCCACCCGAMQAQRNGTPMLASSGYVAEVDAGECQGCGICAKHCQFGAISVVEGKRQVDRQACMGCGVCVSHCPSEALLLARDPSKGEPLEIHALIESVAALR